MLPTPISLSLQTTTQMLALQVILAQTTPRHDVEKASPPIVAPPTFFERLKSKFFKRSSKWRYEQLDDVESSHEKTYSAGSEKANSQAEEAKQTKSNSDTNSDLQLKAAQERVQRLSAKRGIWNTKSRSDQTKKEKLKQALERVEELKRKKKANKRAKTAERGAADSDTQSEPTREEMLQQAKEKVERLKTKKQEKKKIKRAEKAERAAKASDRVTGSPTCGNYNDNSNTALTMCLLGTLWE